MKNENGKIYAFVQQPKKLSLLLNGNERSVYGIMLDYQTMTKKEGFEMSFSYLCKNLNVTDKTAQKIVNRLVELDLIEKVSGYNSRSKNLYKVKLEKIYEFEKLTNDEIFTLRNELNSKLQNPHGTN
jgi:predicted transcriptional regulator